MQYITKLDKKKLGEYEKKLITEEVILTDETLMKLNKRTWSQTIKNRGKIIWKTEIKNTRQK